MNLTAPDFEDMHRQRIKGIVGPIDRLTPGIIEYSKLLFLHRVMKVGKAERQPSLLIGDLDPAILFYLADKGYSAQSLKTLCNKQSGLLGISGLSNDIRNLLQLSQEGNERATLAIDIFCYRIRKYIGAYAAVLEPLDAIAFTGGIGENAVRLREQICRGMSQLGVRLDPAANDAAVGEEAQIQAPNSAVKVFVIPTNEQLAIAKDTCELATKEHPVASH